MFKELAEVAACGSIGRALFEHALAQARNQKSNLRRWNFGLERLGAAKIFRDPRGQTQKKQPMLLLYSCKKLLNTEGELSADAVANARSELFNQLELLDGIDVATSRREIQVVYRGEVLSIRIHGLAGGGGYQIPVRVEIGGHSNCRNCGVKTS